jgi:hypothetical protein|tara:strand:+ start:1317 stop:1493 length:177 start_codon:yes stop_codon:yes gene_type:complete
MKKIWMIWKHALGSFDEEDGYDAQNENRISVIRTFIVLSNLICVWLLMINILIQWKII